MYRELSTSYREEYVMYNLAALALAQAMPRLQVRIQNLKLREGRG